MTARQFLNCPDPDYVAKFAESLRKGPKTKLRSYVIDLWMEAILRNSGAVMESMIGITENHFASVLPDIIGGDYAKGGRSNGS
jgi:hypothetical protein